ncbi:MAG: hypothetical protein HOV80_29430 [Polyangiaceae bacterium]|nr:hypothetical protein [Polyangiaceae bacterium]
MDDAVRRLVGTAWALCQRPRLYTPTGDLAEVVSYLGGRLDSASPTAAERRPPYLKEFADWLSQRFGEPELELDIDTAVVHAIIKAQFPTTPVAALWNQFEEFAAERLGVPQGTVPEKLSECGYCSDSPKTWAKSKPIVEPLFTVAGAWSGGWYEIAFEYRKGGTERAFAGLRALWSHPKVGPGYPESDIEPQHQTPLEPAALSASESVYGVCVLPSGASVPATSVLIEYEHGPCWLYFGFPMGSLDRTIPVGPQPFKELSEQRWRRDVDQWLRELGADVFAKAPFDCALIGFEVDEDMADQLTEGVVPERRWDSILLPRDGELGWYPSTDAPPYKTEE